MIFETTQVNDEGGMSIPETIRAQMDLRPGEKFLVTASGNSILLKRLVEKTPEEAEDFWERVKPKSRVVSLR